MTDTVHILSVGLDSETEEKITAALERRHPSIHVESMSDSVAVKEGIKAQSFDCVVSSETLDDETGVEMVRTVRAAFPHLPFIMLVDTSSDTLVCDAIEAGVTVCIPKPRDYSHFSLLADRIFEVVNQYHARERVAELERINAVIREINRTLVHAATQDEIDQRVCEIISDSESYLFAWIGEHDSKNQEVIGRYAAGAEEGYLDEITITTNEEPTAQGPTGRAVRTLEAQIMQNIPEDPAYEPWREQALERGYRSSAAIPLVYDETLFGVLNVYADRIEAFDGDERSLLEELGETIARAYHEVRIREEARRFQRAIDSTAHGVYITDPDGRIEYVNSAFETITGYAASDVFGKTPRMLKSGEMPDAYYEDLWETILAGDLWREEVINRRNDGDLYYADQTITPITDGDGKIEAFVAVQTDITERKQRQAHLQKALAMARMGYWTIDIQSEELHWSVETYDIFGIDSETEISHQQCLEFVHPDDRDHVVYAWERALEGEPYDIEHRIVTPGGEVRWLRETAEITFGSDGKPLTGTGIAQDITRRKLREKALQTQKEEYEAVVENVHDGIVIVQDEIVQFVNRKMTEITGYAEGELIGKPFIEFIPSEHREKILERHRKRLEGKSPPATYESELIRRDGEQIPVEFSVGLFGYEGDSATITAIRDISTRSDQAMQLRVLERVLRHNLRNNMTTIQGNAELIERQECDNERVREAVETILQTSQHLVNTVEKQREIVEIIANPPDQIEIAIGNLCKEVVSKARTQYPDSEVDLEFEADICVIGTSKLSRGIEELVENAIIHNDHATPRVDIAIHDEADSVSIEIRDNGSRIPEEEVNVLTRAYEVEPMYHGSGLGLWLVNWIVRQAGGTLKFEENHPQGNVVIMELHSSAPTTE